MINRVVESFNNPTGDRCVDIFLRDDGRYGFEEYRRDVEDMREWFPLHRQSGQVYATERDALTVAKATIPWLAGLAC